MTATVILLGCGQLLGVDDYSVAPPAHGADADASEAKLPFLPALPDVSRRLQCENCVRANCAPAHTACLASASCRNTLRCKGGCDDPACLANCEDTLPRSHDFDDYFDCAFAAGTATTSSNQCPDDCGAGENWDCREHYSWGLSNGVRGSRRVEVMPFDLTFDPTNSGRVLQTMPGVQVAPCSDAVPDIVGNVGCGAGVGVDASGLASVSLKSDQTLFTIAGGLDEQHRYYPRPFPKDAAITAYTFGVYSIRYFAKILASPGVDASRGVLMFTQVDCLGDLGGANVVVEVQPRDSGAIAFSPQDNTLVRTSPPLARTGVYINLPPGKQVSVQGIGPDGKPWSNKTVVIAPGWITDVMLYPNSNQ